MIRLVACLCLLPVLAFATGAPQSDLRLLAGTAEPVWTGQETEIYLELWSDGFSFSDQSFVLPEVSGGFLLQTDASTVKLNETRDGVSWQGLRYVLLFYPQRPGRVEVPSFDVRFAAAAGFGMEAAEFAFRTEPLYVEVRQPPGSEPGAMLVTTSSFTLDAAWSRSVPDGEPLRLQTGDALTLDLQRRAADVPGMVLAPLEPPEIDGLGIYASRPVVTDRANRGELTGERRDALTFVCEKPGRYELPEWRFQWWDPKREVLEQRVVPAVTLEVVPNPSYAATTSGGQSERGLRWRLVGLLAAALVLGGFALRYAGWLDVRARQLRKKITRPEAGRSRSGALQPLNPRSSR
jgi:hypothetical protein